MVGGIALLASLPLWATGQEWPPLSVPPRWYVFWGLIAMLIGWRCLRAVFDARPALVQAAVRSCIFSLVILDAGACLAVQDIGWGSGDSAVVVADHDPGPLDILDLMGGGSWLVAGEDKLSRSGFSLTYD